MPDRKVFIARDQCIKASLCHDLYLCVLMTGINLSLPYTFQSEQKILIFYELAASYFMGWKKLSLQLFLFRTMQDLHFKPQGI